MCVGIARQNSSHATLMDRTLETHFHIRAHKAIITSKSHDTRESSPFLADLENTLYSQRPLGASSHVPLARSPASLETLHDLFFMLWKLYQRSLTEVQFVRDR